MKNKKGQAELWAIVLGVIGAISTWVMAARMGYGVITKVIITLISFAACYGIVWFVGNK